MSAIGYIRLLTHSAWTMDLCGTCIHVYHNTRGIYVCVMVLGGLDKVFILNTSKQTSHIFENIHGKTKDVIRHNKEVLRFYSN